MQYDANYPDVEFKINSLNIENSIRKDKTLSHGLSTMEQHSCLRGSMRLIISPTPSWNESQFTSWTESHKRLYLLAFPFARLKRFSTPVQPATSLERY